MRTGSRRRLIIGAVAAVLAVALLGVGTGAAATLQGKLDRSFGKGGQVTVGLGPTIAGSSYTGVLRRPDGSILLTGTTEAVKGKYNEGAAFVQRRLANGALDQGFTEVVRSRSIAGLAAQEDGDVLYGMPSTGPCSSASTVARLLPNGAPDPSYGKEGLSATVPLAVSYMAIDSAGRLILGGGANVNSCGHDAVATLAPAVARLLPAGSIDKSFGKEGLAMAGTAPIGESDSFLGSMSGLAIEPDGTIVLGGNHSLAAFTETGAVDTEFGVDGTAKFDGLLQAVSSMPDGRLLVAGTSASFCCSTSGHFVVARLTPSGSPDASFGGEGKVDLPAADVDVATAVTPTADGGLVLAGETAKATEKEGCGGSCEFAPYLARLTSTGAVDPDFTARLPQPSLPQPGLFPEHYSTQATALATTASGQILVAGGGEGRDQATLSALGPDGGPDASFGNGGVIAEPRPVPSTTEAAGMAIEPAGTIVTAARTTADVYGERALLFGRRPGGAPDPKLGGAGGAECGVGGETRADGRGRLYQVYIGYARRHYVLRCDPSGRRDTTYGTEEGKGFLPAGFQVAALIVRPSGAALVVGRIGRQDPMALFELTPSGRPDQRFGVGGLARIGWGKGVKAGVFTAAFDARGRVVLFGYEGRYTAMARLLPNGRLDPTYAHGGKQPYLPGLYAGGSALTIAADGRIYLAAGPEGSPGPGVTSLVRFRADGRRDRSFGNGGVVRVNAKSTLVGFFAEAHRLVLVSGVGGFGEGGVALRAFRTDGRADRAFGRNGVVTWTPGGKTAYRPVAVGRRPDGRILVAGTRGLLEQSGASVQLLRFR